MLTHRFPSRQFERQAQPRRTSITLKLTIPCHHRTARTVPLASPLRPSRHWMSLVQLDALYFPLRSSYSLSKDTVSPCCSPSASTSCLQWMNTSSPPSSGVMKPKPLSSNHFFTVPVSDMATKIGQQPCTTTGSKSNEIATCDARGTCQCVRRVAMERDNALAC